MKPILSALELVQATLEAIDLDSPEFRVYSERLLATDPREFMQAIGSPEFRRLAQELRKQRPFTLWAYGAPEAALRAKEEGSLDGIIVSPLPGPVRFDRPLSELEADFGAFAAGLRELPRARGRECWLELPSANAEALMPLVPAGWGVVVRGALETIPFVALRKLARLTPFGVRLDAEPVQTHVPIALDLTVAGPNVGPSESLSGLAPRLLLWADSALDSARLGRLAASGVLCETERSSEWLLRLVLGRPAPMSAY